MSKKKQTSRRTTQGAEQPQTVSDAHNTGQQKPSEQSCLQIASQAANAAILLPEIFEAILLQLDQATLLTTVQRVCRAWHRFMASSTQVQRYLFFEPDPRTTQQALQNPLLHQLLGPDLFFNMPHILAPIPQGQTSKRPPDPVVRISRYAPQNILKMQLPMTKMGPDRRLHAAFVRKGASWRRMLPSQPAGSTRELLHFVGHEYYDHRFRPSAHGTSKFFDRRAWALSFRHRLRPTRAAEQELDGRLMGTNVGEGEVGDTSLRMGELYDAMYYILWGSDISMGHINQACAVMLSDEVMRVMRGVGQQLWEEQQAPSPSQPGLAADATVTDIAPTHQWAIFSSLEYGRTEPGFIPEKERDAAMTRSTSISAIPHEWARHRCARLQRERRSCEWIFESEGYDEERTKRFLRLQSERDSL
ncbi:hypothetical protein Micbo1qcDRAFT_165823 [Microdochium bolleyi]|uniref:F-box domain-containing protein n=1 Tax=Microdochium bolleyi TaxID=196109 RepID=A0A136IVU8_9PEZI|nr:hypothetical protein Micbo1qcDRAFT_165823 [Microdochium bolleyi]